VQAAFESTPGNELNTPTLSTKTIYLPVQTGEPQLNPTLLDRNDELRGVDEPISKLPDIYDPTWGMTLRAYPDPLGFLLKNMLGAPTTTAGNGVITDPDGTVIPTGATKHVFTAPFASSPGGTNYPNTAQYQFSYKDQSVAFKHKGAALQSLEFNVPDSGGVTMQASGPSLYAARVSEPGLTPSYESLTVAPFLEAFLTEVTWLGSSGTATSIGLKGTNPVKPEHTMGIASRFPDAMFKDDGPIQWSGSVTLRNLTAADYDALLNTTGFAVKLRFKSTVNIGATSYAYSFWFEALNAQYVGGGPDPIGNKRIHGASFDWEASYAGTPGSTTLTVVNGTTSYA
jgi:hypothetical protein